MRTGLALVVLLLLSASATASLVETASGGVVSYQFDGDSHHDAPDACQEVGREWVVPANGSTDGSLIPIDDVSDHFILNVTAEDLGERFTVSLREASTPAGRVKASLDILAPLCNGSVLDPENQPPWPPQPGEGQKAATVANPDAHTQCSNRWYFILNGVNASTAPATIHVIWTDGYEETVVMDSAPPYPVGQYQTTSRLGTTLHQVTALVPADWTGNFRLGEAPCNAQDGGYVFGAPAVQNGDTIEFSILKPGLYVVAVRLGEMEARDATQPMPMSCHFCLGAVEEISEKISYMLQASPNDEAA